MLLDMNTRIIADKDATAAEMRELRNQLILSQSATDSPPADRRRESVTVQPRQVATPSTGGQISVPRIYTTNPLFNQGNGLPRATAQLFFVGSQALVVVLLKGVCRTSPRWKI